MDEENEHHHLKNKTKTNKQTTHTHKRSCFFSQDLHSPKIFASFGTHRCVIVPVPIGSPATDVGGIECVGRRQMSPEGCCYRILPLHVLFGITKHLLCRKRSKLWVNRKRLTRKATKAL